MTGEDLIFDTHSKTHRARHPPTRATGRKRASVPAKSSRVVHRPDSLASRVHISGQWRERRRGAGAMRNSQSSSNSAYGQFWHTNSNNVQRGIGDASQGVAVQGASLNGGGGARRIREAQAFKASGEGGWEEGGGKERHRRRKILAASTRPLSLLIRHPNCPPFFHLVSQLFFPHKHRRTRGGRAKSQKNDLPEIEIC